MKPYVFDFLDYRKDNLKQIIRSKRYALILKLIKGHGDIEQTTDSHVCLNCGMSFSGNYCPNCGQDSKTKKLTFKHIVTNFFSGFLNIDSGFLNTIVCLIYRPGYMIYDFLQGKRIKYFKPFQTLFTLALLYLILAHFIDPNAFTSAPQTEDAENIELIFSNKIIALDNQHILKRTYHILKDIISGNKAFILLGMIPFMSFGYYCAFKKKRIPIRLNATETFFAQVYYSCQFLFLSLITLLFTRKSQVDTPFDFSFGMFLALQIWNNHQLYRISFKNSIKHTLLALLYSFIFVVFIITCFIFALSYFNIIDITSK